MAQNIIVCPNCSSKVGSTLRYCPKCGHDLGLNVSAGDAGRDPYEILQVSRNASKDVVDASYKTLARKYHPDTNSSNPEKMMELNWAYEILSNKAKKAKWESANQPDASPKREPRQQTAHHTSEPSGSHRTKKATKKTPSLLTPFAWILIIAIGVGWLFSIFGNNQTFPTSGAHPTLLPTRRSIATPTQIVYTIRNDPDFRGCIEWQRVSRQDVGKQMCVFGVADSIFFPDFGGGSYYIFFNDETSDLSPYFRVASFEHVYFGIQAGQCIAVVGTLKSYGSNSFLYINPASSSNPGEIYYWDDRGYCR